MIMKHEFTDIILGEILILHQNTGRNGWNAGRAALDNVAKTLKANKIRLIDTKANCVQKKFLYNGHFCRDV